MRACQRLGWDVAAQRCVVQGFGNVGSIAAAELHELGAKVTAVSDVSGGIDREDGLDIPVLQQYAREHGSLEGCTDGERITNEELLELDCDILVLAAREDQVTVDNAPRIQARMVAEGANGPTSSARTRFSPTAASGPARHPHERRRRHGLVLRVGPGPRSDLLDARRDPGEARGEALGRVRPRVGLSDEREMTLRAAALVSGIREVAAALNARGIFP